MGLVKFFIRYQHGRNNGGNCVIFTQSVDPILLPLTVCHFTRISRDVVRQLQCLHHPYGRHFGRIRNDEIANFARSEKMFSMFAPNYRGVVRQIEGKSH
jgi:hypothetical protein